MYGYTNEQGEPIMDGVAYRFEQQLDMDSAHDYYEADQYNQGYYDEPEPLDPAECDHGDGSYPEGAGFDCDKCESLLVGPRTKPGVIHIWDESGEFFTKW